MQEVSIVLVGKYTKLEDAYISLTKALRHAALAIRHKLILKVGTEVGIAGSVVIRICTVYAYILYTFWLDVLLGTLCTYI